MLYQSFFNAVVNFGIHLLNISLNLNLILFTSKIYRPNSYAMFNVLENKNVEPAHAVNVSLNNNFQMLKGQLLDPSSYFLTFLFW